MQCIEYEIAYQTHLKKIMVNQLDLSTNHFPPFIFSRVKCYTNSSEKLL